MSKKNKAGEGFKDFWRARPRTRSGKVSKGKGVIFYNPQGVTKVVFYLSSVLFLCFLAGAVWLYTPLVKAIVRYQFHKGAEKVAIVPPKIDPVDITKMLDLPSSEFSIYVPKIEAKSKVIRNVNAGNKTEYMDALEEGVAHAAGSAYPGQGKTVYLFAHSTRWGLNQIRYNAVFYLLDELVEGDLVQVVKDNKLYEYVVEEKKVVGAKEVEYLEYKEDGEVLILQTCWPIGTTWKRLLLFARPR